MHRRSFLILGLIALIVAPGAAQAESGGIDPGLPAAGGAAPEAAPQEAAASARAPGGTAIAGFSREGSSFHATATGSGASPAEAQERARGAALHVLFDSLGKDRLFAEVFIGSPPLGLSLHLDELKPPAAAGEPYVASVTLSIDDESLRIVEQGPYLAAAISLLDEAEQAEQRGRDQSARGSGAESQGRLGDALGAYGMAQDSALTGLAYIDPLEDSSIFSSRGKRTTAELRLSLHAEANAAQAGIDRVRQAEAALAANDSLAAAATVIDTALTSADSARKLLDDSSPLLKDVSAAPPDRLRELRERLALERRGLADASSALARATEALPAADDGGRSYVADKADFARRRLATADAALEDAWGSVDLEIRDPTARREARAQATRWVFFHVPREYLQVRTYLPFEIEAGDRRGFGAAAMDLRVGAEGAFSSGDGGIWVRSALSTQGFSLAGAGDSADERSLSQCFDLGFWGKRLWFVGYGWEWYRSLEGSAQPAASYIRLGLGGVSSSDGGFPRADWTIALSYQIPYQTDDPLLWNLLNAGLEAQFRLGTALFLEASVAQRLHKNGAEAPPGFDSLLSWSVGLGFHLPAPFSFGFEYDGSMVSPLGAGDEVEYADPAGRESFRFFLGYSI